MADVGEGRPRGGARKRCSDPKGKGCRGFARRNSDLCYSCGGGTRAAKRHTVDPDTGARTTTARGLVSVPDRVQQLLDGRLDPADLDDEELARGYPRASDGSFRGAPSVVPRSLHDRMARELFSRANVSLRENLNKAVEAITQIALNEDNDPKIRFQASQWVVERVMGKTPDVQISVEEKRYQKLFEEMDRESVVIEGEIVEDGRTA